MTAGSRHRVALLALVLAGAAVLVGSLALGRFLIPVPEVVRLLVDRAVGDGSVAAADGRAAAILFDVRMPRIIAAFLVGAALSLSGAVYQGLFRNPMVSPDLLGASAGAGFGAAVAILSAWSVAFVQLSAFAGGLLAVGIACAVGRSFQRSSEGGIIALVLTGMLVATVFASGISLAKFCADPDNTLPAITFWLMGGLSDIRTGHLWWLAPALLCGAVPLLLLRWKFNVLSLGDEEARTLGLHVRRIRLLTIACATLLTSASVAMCGIIGFVGLVVPHMARLLFGADQAIVLPASVLLGGMFLVIVDDVARCALPVEIPLGILCSLIGAPFFLVLLVRGRRAWL